MSEEAPLEDQSDPGFINITLTEDSVKYDTNMSVPDMLFWVEVVKSMTLERVLTKSDV